MICSSSFPLHDFLFWVSFFAEGRERGGEVQIAIVEEEIGVKLAEKEEEEEVAEAAT